MDAIRNTEVDRLKVRIFQSRREMGHAAARVVARRIRELQQQKKHLRMIFAAAPSQVELLECLAVEKEIDWSSITAFHMDEYIGLSKNAPQGFGHFLYEHLFGKVDFNRVHYINTEAGDPEAECKRYGKLIGAEPIDIICLGIGENGHIAFNDPPVADFNDPVPVKVVTLDQTCRQQQVNEGCFPTIKDVPLKAITITVPVFMAAAALYVVVPGSAKAEAVHRTLTGPIDHACPASVLRHHENATLFLDPDSAGRLD